MTWPCPACVNNECSDPKCRGGAYCQAALCTPTLYSSETPMPPYEYQKPESGSASLNTPAPEADLVAGPSAEDNVILAMCRAHDREAAAQKGEPSPWDLEEARSDHDWMQERYFAMREAFDVAKTHLSARHNGGQDA